MRKFKLIPKFTVDKENIKTSKINYKRCKFFIPNQEYCTKLEWYVKDMVENEIEEMEVILAKRETDVPYFYCRYYCEVGDKNEGGCGRMCKGYQPKNGKSGVCKHYGHTYEPTDICFTLKLI